MGPATFSRITSAFLFVLLFLSTNTSYAETVHYGPSCDTAPIKINYNGSGENIILQMGYSSLWHSIDNGASWNTFDDYFFENYGYTFYNTNTTYSGENIYFIGYKHNNYTPFVFCSYDNGSTWQEISPENFGYSHNFNLIIDRRNPAFLLLSTNNYLYKSYDNGQYWIRFDLPFINSTSNTKEFFQDISVDTVFYLREHKYECDSNVDRRIERVYKSENNAESWNFESAFIDFNEVCMTDTVNVASFLQLSNGEFIASAYTFSDDQLTNNILLFDSDGFYIGNYGDENVLCQVVFEDCWTPGRIYAISSGLLVSDDYGRTWSESPLNGIPEDRRISINDITTKDDKLAMSLRGLGWYESENQGENWTKKNSPPLNDFYSISSFENHVSLENYSDRLYLYDAEIDSFSVLQYNSNSDTISFFKKAHYINNDTIVATVYSSLNSNYSLVKSVDAGCSWSEIASNEIKFEDIPIENGCRIITHDYENLSFLVTEDFGQTWLSHPMPIEANSGYIFQVQEMNKNHYYTCMHDNTNNYEIFSMGVEDNTWESLNFQRTETSYPYISAFDNGLMVFCDNQTYLYQNETWQRFGSVPLCSQPHAAIHITSTPGLFLCYSSMNNQIAITINSGISWELLYLEIPEDYPFEIIHKLHYDSFRERVWFSTNKGTMWFDAEYLLDAPEEGIDLHPADYELFSAYPNPFNASTKIQYSMPQACDVKLDVYDITGRLVKTLFDGFKSAGQYECNFDAQGLSSGTYLLKLQTGQEVKSRRITLIK